MPYSRHGLINRAFYEEIFTMRVALLTGGGDCPGLNAVIYAAVRKGINHYGDEFIGFLNGWRGVLDNTLHSAHAGKY